MTLLYDLSTANLALVGCGLSIAYIACLVIYRLWLSPVAGFPGAFWPKVTFLNEFYWEWIKPGQYYQRIHEMHKQFGRAHPESKIHVNGSSSLNRANHPSFSR